MKAIVPAPDGLNGKCHGTYISDLVLTPDGRYCVSASRDTTIKVWRMPEGILHTTFQGHKAQIDAIALLPDGEHLISAAHDGSLKVWRISTGAEQIGIEQERKWCSALILIPHTPYALLASSNTIGIWDLEQARKIHEFRPHATHTIWSVVADQEGHIFTGASDHLIKMWKWNSGEVVRSFQGHFNPVTSIALSSDGQHVIAAASGLRPYGGKPTHLVPEYYAIRVWERHTGNQEHALYGHEWVIWSLTIVPHSPYIVSASWDQTLRGWDILQGQLVASWRAEHLLTTCVSTSDGTTVIVGDSEGHIYTLHLNQT